MPLPKIAAVATAVPERRLGQAELLALAGYTDERRRGFFEKSDIDGRHLYLDPHTFRPDETLDELQVNLQEVVSMLLEDGEPRLESEFVGVQTIKVA